MGTRDGDNGLVAVQLTVDLKPNLPGLCPGPNFLMMKVFSIKLNFDDKCIFDYLGVVALARVGYVTRTLYFAIHIPVLDP